MRAAVFFIRALAALAFGLAISSSASALNMNATATNGLSTAFGFVHAQAMSLKAIAQQHPALQRDSVLAQAAFDARFPGIEGKLEKALRTSMGPAEWPRFIKALDAKLAPLHTSVSAGDAATFLAQVHERAKGKIDSPVLEYILAVQYEGRPAGEYLDGFRQPFRGDGSGKMKGVKVEMQLPRSWLGQEANRPNIVRKWVSANGTGMETIMLLVMDSDEQAPTKAELTAMQASGEVRDFVPEGGKYISSKVITVEGQPGLLITFDLDMERAGFELSQRMAMYVVYLKGKAISLQCSAGSPVKEKARVAASFERLEPLCQQVANSIVLPQRYR